MFELFFQLLYSIQALQSLVFSFLVAEPLNEILKDLLSVTFVYSSESRLSLETLAHVVVTAQVIELGALLLEELDKVEACLLLFLTLFIFFCVFKF